MDNGNHVRDAILATIVAVLLLTSLVFIGLLMGNSLGWSSAYEAYRKGTLENITKERFPKLWIKYNIDNPKEQKEQNESYDRP